MAKELYPSVNGVSKRTKEWYCSIGGFSRRVKAAYCSENGISKLFYRRGANRYLKQNYEHDEFGTYDFGLADIGMLTRYAIERFLMVAQSFVYPKRLERLKQETGNVISWIRSNIPDDALVVISVVRSYSSTAVDGTAGVNIYIDYIEAENFDTHATTSTEVVHEGFHHYQYTKTWSTTWYRYQISITLSNTTYPRGVQDRRTVSQGISDTYNFIGTEVGDIYNVSVSNFGVYFTEYELPEARYPRYQDYLLYWDFSLTENKIDYNRYVWCMTDNQIQTDPLTGRKYIRTTITLPSWLSTHLFADVEFHFTLSGQLKLHQTVNEQTGVITYYDTILFMYRDRYYFDVKRNENNKAYGAWRFFQTDLEETHEYEVEGISSFSFLVSYEGIVDGSVDYNYVANSNKDIQIGQDRNTGYYNFGLNVYQMMVKMTPIDPKDLYFYSLYYFKESPDGTDIQYNKVVSESMADFTEYLGTNKTFIFTYQESTTGQVTWQIDNRNFGGYARHYIRSPGRNGHLSRIYIPVSHIESANGKYMRVSARSFSYTTVMQFGVAYIDGDSLVEEMIRGTTLNTTLTKFAGEITIPNVDYMWFEDNGDGRTVMISTVKISDTEDEALH